jgi:TPR repeat protein
MYTLLSQAAPYLARPRTCGIPMSLVVISLAAALVLALPETVNAQQPTLQPAAPKRLTRSVDIIGPVDDHKCTLERKYREEDYLASLDEKALSGYLQSARSGDAGAMFLLSQVPKETPNGGREYPMRDPWLRRAADAGHPVAKYFLADEAHRRKEIGDDEFLAVIEAAALFQGGGDIAWRLSFSYSRAGAERGDLVMKVPRNFLFLKGDKSKALHWARIAGAKGNIMAAENLCGSMYFSTSEHFYGLARPNPEEVVRWCTLAAQAICSDAGALWLSGLYRKGIGVAPSPLDALYWERQYKERATRNRPPRDKWEYIGDLEK